MKVAEAHKSNTARNYIQAKQQPFFNKEGQGGFFSKSNEATQSFFTPITTIQSKLTIGQPNDKYEVEADAMADKVVQKLSETPPKDTSISDTVQTKPSNASPVIQSKCEECEYEEKLQKKEDEEVSETDVEVQEKPIFESEAPQPEAEVQTKPLQSVDVFSDIGGTTIENSINGSETTVQTKSLVNLQSANVSNTITEPEEQLQEKEEELSETKEEIHTKLSTADTPDPPNVKSNIQTKSDSIGEANSDLQRQLNSSKGRGSSLSQDVQTSMGNAFGADFSKVRVHTGSEAVQMNKDLGAQAFAHGNDIYFNEGKYDTNSDSGKHLLAHELTHTVQQNSVLSRRIQRETAQEIIERYTNWGGLNLREEDLGAYLATQAKSGNHSIVTNVLNNLEWEDRDDVARGFMNNVSVIELIQMGSSESAITMFTTLKDELHDWWGHTTRGERESADLLAAIIEDGPDRKIWNINRINVLKGNAGNDLEAMALMFEDGEIVDDGTVGGRLNSILTATEHLVVPGLHTGIPFGDEGFAGNQEPNGQGFRDPHPSSRNQVGHFLTAVKLQFSPSVVSQRIPVFGTIRGMVEAPGSMSDQEVALRLTIGHEKGPDPNGQAAAINIVLRGFIYELLPGPSGETEEERDQRIARQLARDVLMQIQSIINAFKRQFNAATDDDVEAWNAAIEALGDGPNLDLDAAEPFLRRIAIDPEMRGNSIQDLRLSLVGWKLGQLIGKEAFGSRQEVASWIRTNLG